MSDPLRDRVIWVTGASSGIGAALARQLSAAGARLILSARREDKLLELARELGTPCAVVPLDVTDVARADDHVTRAMAAFGHIDVMVHNAGVSQRAAIRDTTIDVDRRIMDVNYFGVVALTKALLPHWPAGAKRRGHFVVVSSVTGYVGTPQRSSYAASKHALHGFFESLRAELHDAVDVTMVCPGWVDTDIATNALNGDGSAHGVREKRNAEGITPEACAAAIVVGIRERRRETYVGRWEIAGIYARRFVPAILARALRRVNTV